MSYLIDLECSECNIRLSADQLTNLCPDCSRPLLARYDTDKAGNVLTPEILAMREPTLWRYREMLPVKDDQFIVTPKGCKLYCAVGLVLIRSNAPWGKF